MLTGLYTRILVPLDGSEESERILAFVEPLAGTLGATLLLLRVTTPLSAVVAAMIGTPGVMAGANLAVDPTPLLEGERQEAISYLDSLGLRLRRKGIAVECVQEEGQPAMAIVKMAYQLQPDLIAMASRGRRGLRRFLDSLLGGGSVADAVRRDAPCPVFLARAGEDRAGQGGILSQAYRLGRSRRWVPLETFAS